MNIRRAEASDAPLITRLVSAQSAAQQCLREQFCSVDAAQIIDVALLSLVLCNDDNTVCEGFIALHHVPAPFSHTISTGLQPPEYSENWAETLQTQYPDLGCEYHNTLFLLFSVVTAPNPTEFLFNALCHAFALAPLLRSVLYLLPDGATVPQSLGPTISTANDASFVNLNPSTDSVIFTQVPCTDKSPLIFQCRRDQILPRLNIRRARMEDCDDLIPMFKRHNMLEASAGDYYVAELLESKDERMKTLVAEVGNKVVGFMSLCRDVNYKELCSAFWLETYSNLINSSDDLTTNTLPKFASISNPGLPRLDPQEVDTTDADATPSAELHGDDDDNDKEGNNYNDIQHTDHDDEHDVTLTTAVSQSILHEDATGSIRDLVLASKNVNQSSINSCNAFCIKLFCIEDAHSLRSVDFLLPAFTLFPERDYCLLTMPATSPEIPLLSRFTQVLPKQTTNIPTLLYLVHRFAVADAVLVQPLRQSSIPEICEMINNLPVEGIVEDLLSKCEQEFEPQRVDGLASFTVHIYNQIVGNVILEYCDARHLAESFDTELFVRPTYHELTMKPVLLRHFLINPLFEWYTRYIIQEMFRICRSSVLFYKLDGVTEIDTATKRLMTRHMAPVRYRYRASSSCDNQTEQSPDHALLMTCTNQLYEPKVAVNHRIVIVGDSDTSLSCLESFIYTTHLYFSNIELLSSDGLRDNGNEGESYYSSKRSYDMSTNWLSHLGLRHHIRVRNDFMQSIQRVNNRVRLRRSGLLYYDYLLLCPGVQFSYLCEKWATTDMTGIWNVHRHSLQYLQDQLDYISNYNVVGDIYIYGIDLHAYATIKYLLNRQVPVSRIRLLISDIETYFENPTEHQLIINHLAQYQIDVQRGIQVIGVKQTAKRVTNITFKSSIGQAGAQELPCALMVYCNQSRINMYTFRAINDSSLVYDNGIIISNEFGTKDTKIFAAGSATKYSKKYQTPWQHAYYNAQEVGSKFSSVVLRDCDPLWEDDPLAEKQLHHFTTPKTIRCYLPGHYVYFHFGSPHLPTDTLEARKKDPQYGRDLTTTKPQRTFSIHLDKTGYITSMSYFGPDNVSLDKYLALSGMHEKYLNSLATRYDDGLIDDFVDFLNEPWAAAVLHDRFTDFVDQMRQELTSTAFGNETAALYTKLEPYFHSYNNIPTSALDEIYRQFDQTTIRETMDRRLQKYARPLLP